MDRLVTREELAVARRRRRVGSKFAVDPEALAHRVGAVGIGPAPTPANNAEPNEASPRAGTWQGTSKTLQRISLQSLLFAPPPMKKMRFTGSFFAAMSP